MKTQYVVRADYYSDGTIVPLGITITNKSYFINIIKSTRRYYKDGEIVTEFICESNEIKFILQYIHGKWRCDLE